MHVETIDPDIRTNFHNQFTNPHPYFQGWIHVCLKASRDTIQIRIGFKDRGAPRAGTRVSIYKWVPRVRPPVTRSESFVLEC